MNETTICTKTNREPPPPSGEFVPMAVRMVPCNGRVRIFVLGKTDIRICDRCDVPEPARSEVS